MSAFTELLKRVPDLVEANSTTILTAMGVSGVMTTAVLTHRATKEATLRIAYETTYRENNPQRPEGNVPLTRREMVEMTWPLYIAPVVVGTVTIGSILWANQLAAKKAAALALSSTMAEKALQEYKEAVMEKLTPAKANDVRETAAQKRADATPIHKGQVILAGTGEVLCFDYFSGRYFQSSVNEIEKAQNKVNLEVVNYMSCSLSKFYDEIGLPPTSQSDKVGWNTENRCEVTFTAIIAKENNQPCVAIDFLYGPIHDYDKLWG